MRYVVSVPNRSGETSYHLGSALTPAMTRTYSTFSSRGPISGAPGTQAVSAPYPVAVPQDKSGQASMGIARSSDAPGVIFPSLYRVAGWDQEHAPISRISDNQMPVPALRPANVIVADPFQARIGGQRQVVQPQVVQKWLGMRGTSNG